jgi:hypothetical protein
MADNRSIGPSAETRHGFNKWSLEMSEEKTVVLTKEDIEAIKKGAEEQSEKEQAEENEANKNSKQD